MIYFHKHSKTFLNLQNPNKFTEGQRKHLAKVLKIRLSELDDIDFSTQEDFAKLCFDAKTLVIDNNHIPLNLISSVEVKKDEDVFKYQIVVKQVTEQELVFGLMFADDLKHCTFKDHSFGDKVKSMSDFI